ncbi:MAG: EF-Tu/IF-2/RF-3 family GTPase [Actinomycetota bacterium]|nr:EF-Tu/IF-2/RF-3 family GTPase [Actinomycetota bacterium]
MTSINWDNYKGRVATGKIYNGKIRAGQEVMLINRKGHMKRHSLSSLMNFQGLTNNEIDEDVAGSIVSIAGIPEIMIGETVADIENPVALPLIKIRRTDSENDFFCQHILHLQAKREILEFKTDKGKVV